MNFSRTVCTNRECIIVEIDGYLAAQTNRSIVIEINSAKNLADEALGPDVSCAFNIGPDTARKFSAVVLAAYVAAAADNPRSELVEGHNDEESGLSLDVGVIDGGNVCITFEQYRDTRAGLTSLVWKIDLDPRAAAQLSEALLSASKIAAETEALSSPSQRAGGVP